MVNIHFFGCSYTAGDELSDDEFFPWKHECKDAEEYISRKVIPVGYEERNKKFAYPALIESLSVNTFNHALNGAGIGVNILNIIEIISAGNKIDYLYFQIPPYGRELAIDTLGKVITLRLGWSTFNFNEYLNAKIISHNLMQYSMEDLMDLITLHGYLKSMSIEHKFILLEDRISDIRINDLKTTRYSFLINEFYKLPILNLSQTMSKYSKTLNGHYDKNAHIEIARLVTSDLRQNNII
jgi:hypothetical protein